MTKYEVRIDQPGHVWYTATAESKEEAIKKIAAKYHLWEDGLIAREKKVCGR